MLKIDRAKAGESWTYANSKEAALCRDALLLVQFDLPAFDTWLLALGDRKHKSEWETATFEVLCGQREMAVQLHSSGNFDAAIAWCRVFDTSMLCVELSTKYFSLIRDHGLSELVDGRSKLPNDSEFLAGVQRLRTSGVPRSKLASKYADQLGVSATAVRNRLRKLNT